MCAACWTDETPSNSINAIYRYTYTSNYYPCIEKPSNTTEGFSGLKLELTGDALVLRSWPSGTPAGTTIYGPIKLERDFVILSSLYTDLPQALQNSRGISGQWSNIFDKDGGKLGVAIVSNAPGFNHCLFLGKDSLFDLRKMFEPYGVNINQFKCESFNVGWLDKGGNGIIVRAMNE